MSAEGSLVVLVGIDGSGKSTQAALLVDALRARCQTADYVWARWEPFLLRPANWVISAASRKRAVQGDSGNAGDREDQRHARRQGIKRRILGAPGMKAAWFHAAMAEYLWQVRSRVGARLRKPGVLVCDRYLPDMIVDLATNFGEGAPGIERMMRRWIIALFPAPAAGVFIDVPARLGYERKRDGTPLAYLEERRERYAAVAECAGLKRVDGESSVETVHARVLDALEGAI